MWTTTSATGSPNALQLPSQSDGAHQHRLAWRMAEPAPTSWETQAAFWESRGKGDAVDLWEEDQDPLCGKLSDDSDDDEAPGKPRPWNFTDDHACSDEEHPEGGVLLALRESLVSGQLAQVRSCEWFWGSGSPLGSGRDESTQAICGGGRGRQPEANRH